MERELVYPISMMSPEIEVTDHQEMGGDGISVR